MIKYQKRYLYFFIPIKKAGSSMKAPQDHPVDSGFGIDGPGGMFCCSFILLEIGNDYVSI